MNLDVKILGPGCAKCKMLKRHAQVAVTMFAKEAPHVTINLQSVSDLNAILRYEVLSTPVLVINEQVIAVGKVLRTEEILAHLRTALADQAVPAVPGA